MRELRTLKSMLGLALSIGMLVYALPRLEVGRGLTPETLFGVAWISMALLIIAAHLRAALRVDEADPPGTNAADALPSRAQK